jgi:hypothetical protein
MECVQTIAYQRKNGGGIGVVRSWTRISITMGEPVASRFPQEALTRLVENDEAVGEFNLADRQSLGQYIENGIHV